LKVNIEMAEQLTDDGLFAIEVDADDYAETAAGDAPSNVPRTYQSEADFQAQKASYTAKVQDGNNYEELLKAVPALRTGRLPLKNGTNGSGASSCSGDATNGVDGVAQKTNLSKKDVQLLGYAAGELYYDRRYEELKELCGRVRERCEVDVKVEESLRRWSGRCEARLGVGGGSGSRDEE
jgi:hypothetical protein